MPSWLSQLFASQGAPPPSPAALAMPAGAVAVPPSAADAIPPTAPTAAAGIDPKMYALMQAFGGLRAPAAPPPPDVIRPPAPIAPQAANPTAIANTGATSAIASLLAAGLRPANVPSLGQLITPGGR